MLRSLYQNTIAVVVVICLSGTCLLAQAPATAPATMPTTPADATTPQGTLTLLSRATQTGDSASVRDLFHSTNDQQKKMADLMLQRAEVFAKFRQALVKQFGEDTATELTGTSLADEVVAEQRINEAVVKIDADTAKVQMKAETPNAPEPDAVQMVKVDGKWKLPMASLTEGMNANEVEQGLKKLQMVSNIVTQTTAEVESGKYKSADELSDAIKGKLASAMLAEAAANAAEGGPAPATMPSRP
jgi:hypothetical protein